MAVHEEEGESKIAPQRISHVPRTCLWVTSWNGVCEGFLSTSTPTAHADVRRRQTALFISTTKVFTIHSLVAQSLLCTHALVLSHWNGRTRSRQQLLSPITFFVFFFFFGKAVHLFVWAADCRKCSDADAAHHQSQVKCLSTPHVVHKTNFQRPGFLPLWMVSSLNATFLPSFSPMSCFYNKRLSCLRLISSRQLLVSRVGIWLFHDSRYNASRCLWFNLRGAKLPQRRPVGQR